MVLEKNNGKKLKPKNDQNHFSAIFLEISKREQHIIFKKSNKKENIVQINAKDEAIFEAARVLYPNTKLGLPTEFAKFRKKHKDWQEVLPKLTPAINRQIAWRANANGEFRPAWKSFSAWIHQRWWELEIPEKKQSAVGLCIIDRKVGFKYQKTNQGVEIWLCQRCYTAFGSGNWANLSKAAIEKIIERNKAASITRTTPKEPSPEAVINDNRNREVKKLMASMKNFGNTNQKAKR